MKIATLCFLTDDSRILLSRKKKKIGAGKWNGFGGGVEPGENIEEAAVREAKEECGASVRVPHLQGRGVIAFYADNTPTWTVHIFITREWHGNPRETGEMGEMRWFDFGRIPYADMLPADKEWLPLVLAGKAVEGNFYYNADVTVLEHFQLTERNV